MSYSRSARDGLHGRTSDRLRFGGVDDVIEGKQSLGAKGSGRGAGAGRAGEARERVRELASQIDAGIPPNRRS